MNYNTYIFYDFETGSRNPFKTQPIQLAAIAIDPRKLTIIDGSEFNSLIRPLSDEEAIKNGLDPIQDDALAVNKKTREQLAGAQELSIVWKNFVNYTSGFNWKKDKWNAPIPVGYNNRNFDDHIIRRISEKFGNVDKEDGKTTIFHPIYSLDMIEDVFKWIYEDDPEVRSTSMDKMRDYLGFSREGAHDALVDVKQGAEFFIRMQKFYRKHSKRTKFKGSFADGKLLSS